MARFECGHPGCREVAHFNVYGREDERRLYRDNGNGKYRCIRHTRMDEVLTNERRKIIREMASEAKVEGSPKLYWGNFGMAHGPGFKAFADDFPAGTVIRVTAEIILPEAKGDAAEDARASTERHEVTTPSPKDHP
jgi:hypothetical protein